MLTKEDIIKALYGAKTSENESRADEYIKRISSMSDEQALEELAKRNIASFEDLEAEVREMLHEPERQKFANLNDLVACGFSGDTIHIHLIPQDARFLLTKAGMKEAEVKLIDALEQIQNMLMTDENLKDINSVYAVSGIMKGPISKAFKGLAFDVKTMRMAKAKEDPELKFFYDRFKDKKNLGRAFISKERLLSKEWNKLKDKRKLALTGIEPPKTSKANDSFISDLKDEVYNNEEILKSETNDKADNANEKKLENDHIPL